MLLTAMETVLACDNTSRHSLGSQVQCMTAWLNLLFGITFGRTQAGLRAPSSIFSFLNRTSSLNWTTLKNWKYFYRWTTQASPPFFHGILNSSRTSGAPKPRYSINLWSNQDWTYGMSAWYWQSALYCLAYLAPARNCLLCIYRQRMVDSSNPSVCCFQLLSYHRTQLR